MNDSFYNNELIFIVSQYLFEYSSFTSWEWGALHSCSHGSKSNIAYAVRNTNSRFADLAKTYILIGKKKLLEASGIRLSDHSLKGTGGKPMSSLRSATQGNKH